MRLWTQRSWWKKAAWISAGVAIAIQVVPINHRNPPVDRLRTLFEMQEVPQPVKAAFERSCMNCHSNETAWPWYSYVAPVSWIIANDVHGARSKMNFSEWGSYSDKRKEDRLEEICEQVTNGDMPDRKYAFFHREARLTQSERDAVCRWTDDAREY